MNSSIHPQQKQYMRERTRCLPHGCIQETWSSLKRLPTGLIICIFMIFCSFKLKNALAVDPSSTFLAVLYVDPDSSPTEAECGQQEGRAKTRTSWGAWRTWNSTRSWKRLLDTTTDCCLMYHMHGFICLHRSYPSDLPDVLERPLRQ